jgi:hypothetical protein
MQAVASFSPAAARVVSPGATWSRNSLYVERMALAFGRHYGMQVRIARLQNCYGPEGTWSGGRERRPEIVEGKAPAAICRKAAEVEDGGVIEVWGDGTGGALLCGRYGGRPGRLLSKGGR